MQARTTLVKPNLVPIRQEPELKNFKEIFTVMSQDPKAAVPKCQKHVLLKVFGMIAFVPNATLVKEIDEFFKT